MIDAMGLLLIAFGGRFRKRGARASNHRGPSITVYNIPYNIFI